MVKELYNEYFHIPKNGKIRDKVMLVRTAITAGIMIICLAAMSFAAFAYFSHSVTSGSGIIKAATFEADVSISITESNSSTPVDIVKNGNGTQEAQLKAGTAYTVTLTPGKSTAETGFCVITAENCTGTYHTQQLGVDRSVGGGETPSVTFTLTVSNDTTVRILSHWGTSSHYDGYKNDARSAELYILNGDVVNMTVAGAGDPLSGSGEEDENTSTETTTPPTTEPTETVHIIEPGDTLSALASKYGVTVEQIAAYNGLADPHSIQAGAQLKIPSADYEVPADTTEQTTTTEPEETPVPETEPPVTEPPVTEPPVTEPTETEPPVIEPPVTEPPATEPPVTEPPVTEPPATEPTVPDEPSTETTEPESSAAENIG